MMKFGDERLPERFWKKVSPEPNTGCWFWIGALSNTGYGSYWHEERVRNAYCATVETEYGPRPGTMEIDHRCRERLCVNPEHLEYVSPKVNCHRSPLRMQGKGGADAARAKTHCPNGHEYTPENTHVRHRTAWVNGRRASSRQCRICMKTWSRPKCS